MAKSSLITLAAMFVLAILPPALYWAGNAFYLDLATRLVILAIVAVSLNMILGYGGLVSFGHAAFVGIGAYAVGIPVYHEFYGGWDAIASTNGWFHLVLALLIGIVFALLTGAISLRTKGVYFIMITMAFAQMIYYLFISLEEYGGDDGLVIELRSEFPGMSIEGPLQLFALCYVSLVVVMLIVRTLSESRFGMVIRGARGNEERMISMGYNVFAYRLTAYVISGSIAAYAGVLMGNFSSFISPEMIAWSRSGELIFMVILGGAATTLGPVLGAAAFILIEEILSSFTIYWHLPFGLLLIAVVLFMRGGLMGPFKGSGK